MSMAEVAQNWEKLGSRILPRQHNKVVPGWLGDSKLVCSLDRVMAIPNSE